MIEMIVAIFVSSVIMVAVVSIFATFVNNRNSVRNTQQNLENGRAAMEYMAKMIRMSCDIKLVTVAGQTSIYFYSKMDGDYIKFTKNGNNKIESSYYKPATPPDDPCSFDVFSVVFSGNTEISSVNVSSLNFAHTAVGTKIPLITISMTTLAPATTLQTSVSARDYGELFPQ